MRGTFRGFRLDARITGNPHLLFGHRFAEDAIQFLGQHFVASLVAILLLDDAERHLARAEARHLHVLAHTLQALFHFLFDVSDGNGQVDAAFEFVSLCGGCFHEYSL